MKKTFLKTILGGVLALSLHTAASAQVSLSINIGRQPAWGPTGYNHVDYYYLPDIESYYDVSTGQYIYQDGGRWIFANTLPPRYRGYDLYSGYKVVVNRPKPYLNYSRDRVTYGKYKNWGSGRQPMLRESRNNGNHFGNSGNRPGNNGGNRPGNMGGNNGGNRPGNNGGNGNNNSGRPQGGQGQGRPGQSGQAPGQNRGGNQPGGQNRGGGQNHGGGQLGGQNNGGGNGGGHDGHH